MTQFDLNKIENLTRLQTEINNVIESHIKQKEKESLLETLIYRKNTAEKTFLRKINYAYDFQKSDIESYYREKRKELEAQAAEAADTETPPEDEDN